ncbi:MAG: hypothetical protein ACI8WM_002820 [Burkholderiaceae bacterium]|jgi:hypothetical protein
MQIHGDFLVDQTTQPEEALAEFAEFAYTSSAYKQIVTLLLATGPNFITIRATLIRMS